MKRQVAIVTALFAIVVFGFHGIASINGWYEYQTNFDKFMHFLGCIFTFFVIAMYILRKALLPFTGKQLLAIVFLALLIGIAWEVYEYIVQHYTGTRLATIPDSIGDIVFDMYGSLIGAFILFFVQDPKKRYNRFNQ